VVDSGVKTIGCSAQYDWPDVASTLIDRWPEMSAATSKTIFLDSFMFIKAFKDASLQTKLQNYLTAQGRILVVNAVSLIEIYLDQPSRWEEIADFLSAVPFCIAKNPENIFAEEVKHYPYTIPLPLDFCSQAHADSMTELRKAIEDNIKSKIPAFLRSYKKEREEFMSKILTRIHKLPDGTGDRNVALFIYTNEPILEDLLRYHKSFLDSHALPIEVKSFRSSYIPNLSMFLEYYVAKKIPKKGDMGDFFHMSYVPYVNEAVIDGERFDMLERINRSGLLSEPLVAYNWRQFLDTIN